MPALLPPTSAYTYAANFSVDEALAAGATAVQFNQPVIGYLENFINFPVGTAVPLGLYDPGKSAWVPSDNGIVLKILSITNGMADIDANGDNIADSATQLAALGITDAERQRLASLYAAGQTLWRMPLTHFSAWDANWGIFPPNNAVPPNQSPA